MTSFDILGIVLFGLAALLILFKIIKEVYDFHLITRKKKGSK